MSDLHFDVTVATDRCSPDERARLLRDPGFGKVFTDHMVTIRWSEARGWYDARLCPRAAFTVDPACVVFHYGQEVFEGLKAYRAPDGEVLLFRPEENARRLNASMSRLAMPALPEALFLESLHRLIDIDRDWVPEGEDSLYIRPFVFADDISLGVQPATSCVFCVIASPVGAYFKGDRRALSIWVSDDYIRAAPGGTGAAKCGGNYAGSLIAQAQASAHGCDQVLFLDALEHRWVEELANMNVFFVMEDGSIVTPALGTILPGVTRSSVIDLARSAGHDVIERPYGMDEWTSDAASGRLREVFACGTAAVVVSIGHVRSAAQDFRIADGEPGPVTEMLRSRLVGIQRGQTPDPFGWSCKVPKAHQGMR
jgi:branched-chain amino acid aminotransferase